MGLNDTPSGERIHIGFFGRRNAGKSSLVNAVTGQELSVVSDVRGTTTDPVRKAMELLPMGPVVVIDTPGFDDTGTLGALRVRKTRQTLNRTDVAVLAADCTAGFTDCDRELLELFREKEIPYLIAWNKCDLLERVPTAQEHEIYVSAKDGTGVWELKERIAALGKGAGEKRPLVADLLRPSDVALLVIPIDKAAPKGRLILPQQQVIRDALEAGAGALCVRDRELPEILGKMKTPPALVITDSQVFAEAARAVPEEIPLTSFSILMARYKGFLEEAVRGAAAIDRLRDGDEVLIAEGCTHHRQCDDIGSVKLPRWLRERTGRELRIRTCSGADFPEELSGYRLIVHCGGCMLGEREIRFRMKCAQDQGVPFTNYGIAIAYMKGILERSVRMLPGCRQGSPAGVEETRA
ncbi:MAG: [FeFe] hydrogenase H-cluster maturation GTPase HydF [Eubacteriales bacterium]|nr:[FeFe] hydrogenase H-cluster maturation GTPase HydF [Eubacteriales bacterium]